MGTLWYFISGNMLRVFVCSGFVVVFAWWTESEYDETGDKIDEDTADDETDTDLTDQEYKENQ